ncbi:hypothetical protein PR048_011108 [Dryococelus australis]|uniref:Uncharacterized protein n=1 Tax=Dryococelus australis TaxID=614101 RepID=A0ABQ9HKQ5_9NEOP|nr:hypothetical protein PR048_011108 [Dryococelus australis]
MGSACFSGWGMSMRIYRNCFTSYYLTQTTVFLKFYTNDVKPHCGMIKCQRVVLHYLAGIGMMCWLYHDQSSITSVFLQETTIQ